jgi:tetratricopeptide (TPR) repeat protein
VLYGELIDEYRRLQLEPLSEHAIRLSTQLAEQIARRARSSEERRRAANLLTSLSGYLLYSQRLGKTEELLELAVKEDPGNAAALMALAATREQRGDSVAALEVLESLLAVSPDDGEGRLRWGVNLARTGKHSESAESLRLLLAVESDDWIAQVATQELARALTALGESEQAIQILQSASEKWPEQPSMRIQLGWILDRVQESALAGEWLSDLAKDAPQAAESARYRYLKWYEEGLEEVRRSLKELSASGARELIQRLGPHPEETAAR